MHLDEVFHQPGWQALSTGAFRHRVRQAQGSGVDGWVIDGNYKAVVPDVVWPKAETVVWLDFARWVVVPRIVVRTVRRARTGESICNGNVEAWSNLWRRDGIIRWAVTSHDVYRSRYAAASADPAWAGLTWVRLRTPAEAAALLAALP